MFKNIICFLLLLPAIAFSNVKEHSIIVHNTTTGISVVESNQYAVRPVASITKLMTAIVSLEIFQLDQQIKVGKKTYTTVETLLKHLLVRSSNHAAELLATAHPMGKQQFIIEMNRKARSLGLVYTTFDDPSGLSAKNVSTANELIKLVETAGFYQFIRQISVLPTINQNQVNTNKDILVDHKNITVSKTGFTSRAGRCLAMLVDHNGYQYVVIILGESTKKIRDDLARNLLKLTVASNK